MYYNGKNKSSAKTHHFFSVNTHFLLYFSYKSQDFYFSLRPLEGLEKTVIYIPYCFNPLSALQTLFPLIWWVGLKIKIGLSMVHWICNESGELWTLLFTRLLDPVAQQAAIYYSIVATEILKKGEALPWAKKRAKLTRSCLASQCFEYRY